MADQGGISDYAIQAQTRREENDSQNQGYAQLGSALGRQGGAPGTPAGEQAFEKGQSMGAATVNAMAEAQLRVQESTARDTAADFLDKNSSQIPGMDPHLATYLSAGIRGGLLRPDQALDAVKTNQENQYRANYAGSQPDQSHAGEPGMPAYDPLEAQRAAGALAPGSVAPHAIGTAGSTFSPAAASAPGAAPGAGVNISPEQHEMNQAVIGQRQAGAAASNARALATTDGAGVALKPGNMWKTTEEGEIVTDTNGHGVQVPNPAAGTSAVSRRYVNQVVNSTNTISREAGNIQKLGYDSSAGAMQIGGTHTGIMNTVTGTLGKSLSSTEQQEYSDTMSAMARSFSIMESGGQRPNQAFIDKMDSLESRPGNTEHDRLYKLGQMRMYAEAANDTMQSNADAPPAAKAAMRAAVDKIKSAIPWEPSDVIDFQRTGGNQTFQAFLSKRAAQNPEHPANEAPTPAAPAAPAEKQNNDPLGIR